MKQNERLLVVVDMQNDFVTGSLGTEEAKRIIDGAVAKINAEKGRSPTPLTPTLTITSPPVKVVLFPSSTVSKAVRDIS